MLSPDDYASLQEYAREKKAGTLISHEKLKKQLGLK
jgi:hypothetical protein